MGSKNSNEEILQVYIEESLEHLADIENDLLAIEEAGAKTDKELINKVFRAAHSVKGGAGFMGFNNIKELSHKMENVLGMIRNHELVPNADIINLLLQSSDVLRNLLKNAATSDKVNISEYTEALGSIARTYREEEPEEHLTVSSVREDTTPPGKVNISFPDGKYIFSVAQENITNAWNEGKFIYLVDFTSAQMKDTPQSFLDEIQKYGIILDSNIQLTDSKSLMVLFACVLVPEDIASLFEIDEKCIFELTKNMSIMQIQKKTQTGALSVEKTPTTSVKHKTQEHRETPKIKVEMLPNENERGPETNVMMAIPDASLRVHVSLLDSLMTLAGELVLSRNQLLQAVSAKDNRTFEIVAQRINVITSKIQEAIMLTRMQSIGNIFNKFPRVVRDLANTLDKEVELIIEGKDVELDKAIIESISDPLTHLVRNAIDHGIEKPDVRLKSGKDRTGCIYLRAYHEAGQVNIEITDDGKGLDAEKLAAAAMAKGFITKDRARALSYNEKINLIFLPGFSMTDQVTDISGRGVGMDIVKTNLDKLGGHIDIESRVGESTAIRIKLPLTLAIIPSQIIVNEKERYAIPQVNLEELIRIPAADVQDKIEKVGDTDVLRLRGNLIPVIRLADVLGTERTYFDSNEQKWKKDRRQNIADRRSRNALVFNESNEDPEKIPKFTPTYDRRKNISRRFHTASAINIAVVSAGDIKYGLIVDKLLDSEEIVVKPLGRHLKHCKGYAGATIMGDGRVALILDVANIARMSGLSSIIESQNKSIEIGRESQGHINHKEGRHSLLIFRYSGDQQFAVPLHQVVRIEKINISDIEDVGDRKIMHYRGGSLALFSIDEVINVKPLPDKKQLLVIVFAVGKREVGLLATGPVDAVEASVNIDEETLKQPGISGSIIIDGRTTLLLDVFDLTHRFRTELFKREESLLKGNQDKACVLVVEDSKFFRNQVKECIEGAGYKVIDAEDGMMAWQVLQEHGEEISLVVTDLEMPNLDGFGLTKHIKEDVHFSRLPVICLTTLADDKDIQKGKEVGIDDYQIKLDRERLINSIDHFLNRTIQC